jgi:hypothetical protein
MLEMLEYEKLKLRLEMGEKLTEEELRRLKLLEERFNPKAEEDDLEGLF